MMEWLQKWETSSLEATTSNAESIFLGMMLSFHKNYHIKRLI